MQASQSQFDVRQLADDEDEFISILGESLMNYGEPIWKRFLDRIGRDNARSIRRGGGCVGGLAFYRMGQWFGGKPLDCAGISGVAISPQERGSGACRYLLESVLREVHLDGFPLAALYATTQAVYRKVGFEQAGTQTLYSLPISSIESGHDRQCPVQRLKPDSFDLLQRVADRRALAGNGQLQRTDGLWQRLVTPNDNLETKTYLFGDLADPEGYAILSANRVGLGFPQPLVASDIAVTTRRAMERLLALVRDHRSMCDSFRWYGAPNDPLLLVADEGRASVLQQTRWMLRILDVPAALSLRGYPDHLDITLELQMEDELIPANQGNWQLRIAGGIGELRPGGGGSLKLNVRALAPLFSSYFSASDLVLLGQIQTDSAAQVSAADQVFAGPAPWMPELF